MNSTGNMIPGGNEYHPYYHAYINHVNGELMDYLSQQGESFATLLESIDSDKWNYQYAEGKWSVKELMGHILDGERIFVYRALAIARGEKGHIPGFDENAYVTNGQYAHRTAESYYNEFVNIRQSTMDFFNSLHPDDWTKSCPVNGHTMSVRAIGYIIGGHLAHHMGILKERYLN